LRLVAAIFALLVVGSAAAGGAQRGPLIALVLPDDASDAVDIAVEPPDGSGLRNITHNVKGGLSPTWTRDGRHLIFETDAANSGTALWRVESNGSERSRLPGGGGDAASPTGDRVAILEARGRIEIRNVRGELVRALHVSLRPDEWYDSEPIWSPDSRWIAVTVSSDDPLSSRVWLLRTDGSAKARQLSGSLDEYAEAFSPDSHWLLSVDHRAAGYRLRATSLGLARDRSLPGFASAAVTWLADSRRLAYINESRQLVIADLGGKTKTRVVANIRRRGQGPVDAMGIAASPVRDDIAFSTWTGLYLVRAGSDYARRLAKCNSAPNWRPDGSEIAFSRGRAVFAVSAASGRIRTIVGEPQAADSPVWSPDRSRIAFTRSNAYSTNVDVYTVRPDGSGLRRVGNGSEPTWSPDSNRLAFVQDGRIMVADGTSPPREIAIGDSPTWSPDGRTIAFVRHRTGTLYDVQSADPYTAIVGSTLLLVDSSGGAPQVLLADTDPGAPLFHLRWSPDGTTIAAIRYDIVDAPDIGGRVLGPPQLVLVAVRDGSVRSAGDADTDFAWSPDGSHILGISDHELRIFDLRGGATRRIAFFPYATPRGVAWAPDGQAVAYVKCPESCELWIANPDGSAARRITRMRDNAGSLAWAA
jgi:Tol biopolymer transport system component